MQYFELFFGLFILISLSFAAKAQNTADHQTFFIIRHAEKDTGSNPPLSAEGKLRAGDLYKILKNKHIDRIYSTKYLRTKMTGDSLRIYAGIPMVIYKADTTGIGLLEEMKVQDEKSKNILIIGHSNTLVPIAKALGVTHVSMEEVHENEFDNMFIVTKKKGVVSLRIIKYGKQSDQNGSKTKMNSLQ